MVREPNSLGEWVLEAITMVIYVPMMVFGILTTIIDDFLNEL